MISGKNPLVGTAFPNATIEIFGGRDAQGEYYLGTTSADAAGNFRYDGALSGDYITATATDAQGNTSAFSAPFSLRNVYIVSNCQDDGAGSLRDAIRQADNHAGADTIIFQIPLDAAGFDSELGIWRIETRSELTVNNDGLLIDGRSQAAFIGRDTNRDGPEIVLTPAVADISSGLALYGKHNHIDALTINGFRAFQISIDGDSNKVTGCYIGTDATGLRQGGYSTTGIDIRSGRGNIIGGLQGRDRNVIAGLIHGIAIVYGAAFNTICGNYIGVNAAGGDTLGNTGDGIFLSSSAHHNLIGPGNVIGGNTYGIYFLEGCGDSNRVVGNFIGTDANGVKRLGNHGAGLYLNNGGAYTFIGGVETSERNLISGNDTGISLWGAGAHHVQIAGSFIGTDVFGTVPLPNRGHGILLESTPSNNIGPNNLIAFNDGSGIAILWTSALHNTISKNQIHSNGELGIQLMEGSNGRISAPVLTGLNPVVGTAPPNAVVEIFSGPDDEGMYWEATVTADAAGNFSWSGTPTGNYVTATATDAMGNTSQFSAALYTALAGNSVRIPDQFALCANYPNPFNPVTTIEYHVKERCNVTLTLFDVRGEEVCSLAKGVHQPGVYRMTFDAHALPAGIYFYRIRMQDFQAVGKMVLVK
ncbi:MAG: right-handed parallel beta-helix repeat-containing protein [Calditrichaeota bacterium]|nr:right-handed parallel beta-helix repeat-containing protein [Calditrichota bacterium]